MAVDPDVARAADVRGIGMIADRGVRR